MGWKSTDGLPLCALREKKSATRDTFIWFSSNTTALMVSYRVSDSDSCSEFSGSGVSTAIHLPILRYLYPSIESVPIPSTGSAPGCIDARPWLISTFRYWTELECQNWPDPIPRLYGTAIPFPFCTNLNLSPSFELESMGMRPVSPVQNETIQLANWYYEYNWFKLTAVVTPCIQAIGSDRSNLAILPTWSAKNHCKSLQSSMSFDNSSHFTVCTSSPSSKTRPQG